MGFVDAPPPHFIAGQAIFVCARTRNAKVFYPPLSSGARLRDNKYVTAAFLGRFFTASCFFFSPPAESGDALPDKINAQCCSVYGWVKISVSRTLKIFFYYKIYKYFSPYLITNNKIFFTQGNNIFVNIKNSSLFLGTLIKFICSVCL